MKSFREISFVSLTVFELSSCFLSQNERHFDLQVFAILREITITNAKLKCCKISHLHNTRTKESIEISVKIIG